MIEREVKIRVEGHEWLRPLLQAMGATRSGVEQEVNRLLDTADRGLQRRHQVLRVRAADGATFTWKGPADEGDSRGHKTREELEIRFSPQDLETLLALLGRLGYDEVLRYDKQRESWHWQGVVIALDSLSFGDFVEIEGEASQIEQAVRLLKLEGRPFERRSYPELQRLAQAPES